MRPITTAIRLVICALGLIAHHGYANTHSNAYVSNKVQVYTYHEKPPYFIHENKITQSTQHGIYQDFVNYLNAQQSNIRYELRFMPRLRLESQLIKEKLDGIIIGVNPLWFKDKEQTKYLWTNAIMKDKDMFLVNSKSDINFTKPEEFIGLRFAIARGSYYKGITELAKERKITLSSTNSAQQNLEMLAHNRADVTIMSQLTANYFFNSQYPREKFRILATPHDIFERMILIPGSQKHLHQELSIIVEKAALDKTWQDTLEKWHVTELVTTE